MLEREKQQPPCGTLFKNGGYENCSYRSIGAEDFMKVRDGSRADGSNPLVGETLQKEGVDNLRSSIFIFRRLKRLERNAHMPLPRPCFSWGKWRTFLTWHLPVQEVVECAYSCSHLSFFMSAYWGNWGIWLTAEFWDAKRKKDDFCSQGHSILVDPWKNVSLSPCSWEVSLGAWLVLLRGLVKSF